MPGQYGKFNLYNMPLPASSKGRRRKQPTSSQPTAGQAYPGVNYFSQPSAPPMPGSSQGSRWYDPTTGRVRSQEEWPTQPTTPTSPPLPESQSRGNRDRYWYEPTTGQIMEYQPPTGETYTEPFGPFPSIEAWEQAFIAEHGRRPTAADVEDALDSFEFLQVMGRPPTQEEWEVRALTGEWGTYWRGGGGGGGSRSRTSQITPQATSAASPWLPGLYSWRI